MISSKEFRKINDKCFVSKGFKKLNKFYVFETRNLFVIFIILRSYYSDCYYIDYNFIVKAAHPNTTTASISEDDFDFILQPRLTLNDGTAQLKLPNLIAQTYESNLCDSISSFIHEISLSDIDYLRKLLKNNVDFVVSQEAYGFLK